MTKDVLTYENALSLLKVPKVIVGKGTTLSDLTIDFSERREFRLELAPEETLDFKPMFLLQIRVSTKSRLKISLHTQENDTKFCLIRVDYNGATHTNPAEIKKDVPSAFRPYAGKIIAPNHVHYHVAGYASGAWAIPISDDPFPIKTVADSSYMANVGDALKAIASTINLKTKLSYKGSILL